MVHEGSGVGAPACDVRGASSGYQLSVLGCGLKTFLLAFLTSSWYSPSGVRVLTEPGQNVPDWVAKVTIYWLPILEAQDQGVHRLVSSMGLVEGCLLPVCLCRPLCEFPVS